MTLSLRRILLCLFALSLGVSGCDQRDEPRGTSGETGGETTGTGSAARGDAVWIGVAGPFTGDSSEFGVQVKMAVELAVDRLNSAGGINGRLVRLQEVDDAGQPSEAQSVATKLATNPKIMAVIGHFNSSCSLAAKGAYTQEGIVMLSPASTNVEVTRGSDYVFRNIFTDDFQGQSLATYASKMLGAKRVAILYDNDDYGTGLRDSFMRRAAELGVEIVQQSPYTRETNDFRSQLETIRSSNPELILVAGLYKAAGVVAKQARELGITTQLLGGDGVFSQQYITLAGEAAEGTLVTSPFVFELGGEGAAEFAAAFRERWNRDPDAWSALSYDAFQLIVEALGKEGISREGVLRYMKKINSPETAYEGITGRTFFDEHGDSRRPVQVAVVKGGKFVAAEKQLGVEDARGAAPQQDGTEAAPVAAQQQEQETTVTR
jgi:branched-chain amino acid transport system substrate-binding protein